MKYYQIFKGFNLRSGYEYKYMRKGRVICVDLWGGLRLWQVPELLRCSNWLVVDHYTELWKTTYYVYIM